MFLQLIKLQNAIKMSVAQWLRINCNNKKD